MEALSKKSSWSASETRDFLSTFNGPLRIATTTESGFPMICSLWYQYMDGHIHCATQQDAVLVRHLKRDGRCAFEFSPNAPPYFGLRGRGTATVSKMGAEEALEQISSRYLGNSDSPLKNWLLKRSADEVRIEIVPSWMTTWDYRERMSR